MAATAPEFNFKKGGATGDGIIGLYVKGNTDISAYTKTITVGDRMGTETSPINATGVYVEAQGTSSTPIADFDKLTVVFPATNSELSVT